MKIGKAGYGCEEGGVRFSTDLLMAVGFKLELAG
jgi:hypothetical protein